MALAPQQQQKHEACCVHTVGVSWADLTRSQACSHHAAHHPHNGFLRSGRRNKRKIAGPRVHGQLILRIPHGWRWHSMRVQRCRPHSKAALLRHSGRYGVPSAQKDKNSRRSNLHCQKEGEISRVPASQCFRAMPSQKRLAYFYRQYPWQ